MCTRCKDVGCGEVVGAGIVVRYDSCQLVLAFGLLDRIGFDYSFVTNVRNKYTSIRKKLAMKYHPDKGGSTEAMQAINEFYDELTSK